MPRVAAVFARKKIWQAFSHKVTAYGAYPRDAMESKKCWHGTRTGCPWWTGRRRLFWPQALNSSFTLGRIVQTISFAFEFTFTAFQVWMNPKRHFQQHKKNSWNQRPDAETSWNITRYGYPHSLEILMFPEVSDLKLCGPLGILQFQNQGICWRNVLETSFYFKSTTLQRLLAVQQDMTKGHLHWLAKKGWPDSLQGEINSET